MNKALICVTTCNRLPYTKQCLEALFNNTDEPFDCVIIDNGSTQETIDFLKEYENKAKIIYNANNVGVAPALNQGLRERKDKQHFMKLDNDMVVPDNYRAWLTEMIDIIENNTEHIKLIGLSPFPPDRHDHSKRYNIETTTKHRYNIEDPTPLPILGPGKLVHYEVIEKLGAYNESFGKYGFEDTDYAHRARRIGFKSVYHWMVRARHIDAEDLPESEAWRSFKRGQIHRHAVSASVQREGYSHDAGKVRIPL